MAKQKNTQTGAKALTVLASFAASYVLYSMYLNKKLVKELREGKPQ